MYVSSIFLLIFVWWLLLSCKLCDQFKYHINIKKKNTILHLNMIISSKCTTIIWTLLKANTCLHYFAQVKWEEHSVFCCCFLICSYSFICFNYWLSSFNSCNVFLYILSYFMASIDIMKSSYRMRLYSLNIFAYGAHEFFKAYRNWWLHWRRSMPLCTISFVVFICLASSILKKWFFLLLLFHIGSILHSFVFVLKRFRS